MKRQVVGAAFTQLPVAGVHSGGIAWAAAEVARRRSAVMRGFFMVNVSLLKVAVNGHSE